MINVQFWYKLYRVLGYVYHRLFQFNLIYSLFVNQILTLFYSSHTLIFEHFNQA